MPAIGERIGHYRLVTQLSLTPLSALYVAEPVFTNTGAVLLILCTGVMVTAREEQDTLLHTAKTGGIQHGESPIAIQDAGIAVLHPYLVTAYSEEIQIVLQDYLKHVEQTLLLTYKQYPNNQPILFDAFLRTFAIPDENTFNTAPTAMKSNTNILETNTEQGIVTWKSRFQGHEPRKRLIALLVAVLLITLVWGGFFLHINVPAANATVTITPVTKEFSQTYNLNVTAEPGTNLYTVQGRQISYTSQQKVQTVTATGQGTHAATSAKGSIVLSQIHLTTIDPGGNALAVSSVTDANGITIMTDKEVRLSQGGTITIPAHASSGSAGNLAANDFNEQIQIIGMHTKAPIGTATLTNPAPFNGGHDATPYTFVKQSDISNVVNTFTRQLTPDANAQTQKQMQPDEHMMQDIQCATNSSSNHNANSEANNATIKVSVTCSVLVYTEQALHDAATKIYQNAGTTHFGSTYGVAGEMITSKPVQSATGIFPITVNGIWSFQYTPARLQQLKQSIAGKTTQDALQLLHKRPDMLDAALTTSGGIGSAVPTTLNAIQCVVTKVQGLHA